MAIKRLKSRLIANEIYVYDIETAKNGSLLDIGYRTPNDYLIFNSWFNYIYHIYKDTENTGSIIVWAHNGGRFDNVALLMDLYLNQHQYTNFVKSNNASLINGGILELTIEFNNQEKVVFRDSFRLFPMSLDKLLKAFFNLGKVEIDEIYKNDMGAFKIAHYQKYHDYLKRDCDGLYDALVLFRKLVNDISPIGDLPLSLGSLALKVFKTSYLGDLEILTPNKKQDDFLTNAYAGGRTEYFGNGVKDENGIYRKCNYYDVNSMYPAEMQNAFFPVGVGIWTKKLEYNDNKQLIIGAYEIEYNQTGGHIPLLRDQSTGQKSKEHEFIGRGIYTTDEIQYLISIGAEIKIIKGLIFPDSQQIFNEFITDLYNMRLKADREGNAALFLVIKLLMNNLYGKFAQREIAESLVFMTDKQANQLLKDINSGKEKKILSIKPMADLDEYDYEYMPYSVKTKIIVHHRHALIAALITAKCRIKITDIAEKYHETALYCDTDSFITQSVLDDKYLSRTELGMFKTEYANVSMRIWGRKQYQIIEKNEIKQKGVKIKDIDNFVAGIESDGYPAIYYAPSATKQAIKNGMDNASEFKEYTRFIKADLSSREKNKIR